MTPICGRIVWLIWLYWLGSVGFPCVDRELGVGVSFNHFLCLCIVGVKGGGSVCCPSVSAVLGGLRREKVVLAGMVRRPNVMSAERCGASVPVAMEMRVA